MKEAEVKYKLNGHFDMSCKITRHIGRSVGEEESMKLYRAVMNGETKIVEGHFGHGGVVRLKKDGVNHYRIYRMT
jgi:hypothetical protein